MTRLKSIIGRNQNHLLLDLTLRPSLTCIVPLLHIVELIQPILMCMMANISQYSKHLKMSSVIILSTKGADTIALWKRGLDLRRDQCFVVKKVRISGHSYDVVVVDGMIGSKEKIKRRNWPFLYLDDNEKRTLGK